MSCAESVTVSTFPWSFMAAPVQLIPLDQAGRMIELGVVKFNYGTILKQAYLEAVRHKLAAYHTPMSPHPFLGMGGEQDIMVAGRNAVKETVKGLLRSLRSSNQEDP